MGAIPGFVPMLQGWRALPRWVRFVLVGGVNTVFGYAAYALLLLAGLHYAIAALLGTIAGVLFNFLTTGTFVFNGASRGRLARFVGIYCVTYVLNITLLAVLTAVGLDPYLAGLVCIVPMALVSYGLLRHLVFGEL